MTPVRTLGRCPDCGKSAPIRQARGRPSEILEHGCEARACQSPGCLVCRLPEEMIQFPDGSWYCPSHALLSAARELVTLHRSGNGQAVIKTLLEETLPAVLDRFAL
jgi:hypothetical protein